MRILRHYSPFPDDLRGAVLAIGNFDGVHLGHQAVINRAREVASQMARPFGVVTFEPHPRQFFDPKAEPFRLTPFRSKMHALETLGCDVAISLHFDEALARLPAEDFIQHILIDALGVAHLVAGWDFVFGHRRRGNLAMLEAGAASGPAVTSVGPVAGPDGTIYSSTSIRERLVAGDVVAAAKWLGRPWEITGRIEMGDQRGRTIGFPTANINLGEYLRPAVGVYVTSNGIEHPDGSVRWLNGVANIGVRPTVGGQDLRLETHLFDFDEDIYGRSARVLLLERIRPEKKFGSFGELREQIARDAATARAFHAGASGSS